MSHWERERKEVSENKVGPRSETQGSSSTLLLPYDSLDKGVCDAYLHMSSNEPCKVLRIASRLSPGLSMLCMKPSIYTLSKRQRMPTVYCQCQRSDLTFKEMLSWYHQSSAPFRSKSMTIATDLAERPSLEAAVHTFRFNVGGNNVATNGFLYRGIREGSVWVAGARLQKFSPFEPK